MKISYKLDRLVAIFLVIMLTIAIVIVVKAWREGQGHIEDPPWKKTLSPEDAALVEKELERLEGEE